MAPEDKEKTAFFFGQGLWHFNIMPFGLFGRQGVKTDPLKITAVEGWPVPKTVSELWSFLGLHTYYRCLLPRFATITAPLHSLTRKGAQYTRKGVQYAWNKHSCQLSATTCH
ncbi:uncharacterized protein LOC135113367 [Scylla paramamosain]|uniref:uncharacterized protein LOC135113367 n=1 Tax=Scylla paramamosain TaxID=85552 RepID=UPI003082A0B8